VLALGEALVEQLKLKSDDDILGQWIAQYLSEKLTEHKAAKGTAREALGAELVDTILKFWKHRAVFPRGQGPFENYEAVLRALESFDPDRERYFSCAAADEVAAGARSASRQLIDVAKSLDSGTRALINFCFRYAAYASGKPPKAWIDAARVLDEGIDTKIVIRFVDATDELKSSQREPTAAELEIKNLEHTRAELRGLMESANTIGQTIEARLKALKNTSAHDGPGLAPKKKPAHTVRKGRSKAARRTMASP
jgi:hypothetical protein